MLNKSTSPCEARKAYFKLVFGTCYPEKERIAAALKEAHEIRQFEIRLYWQRNLFFWGFILTFFASFVALLTNENQKDFIWALLGIALIGLFTSIAWFYIEKGSGTWQKNWELHIDFLEDHITGKLHKTMLGGRRPVFFSSNDFAAFYFFSGCRLVCPFDGSGFYAVDRTEMYICCYRGVAGCLGLPIGASTRNSNGFLLPQKTLENERPHIREQSKTTI